MSVELTIYGMTGIMIKTPDCVDYDNEKYSEKYNYFEDRDSEFDAVVDGMCGNYFAIGNIHFDMDSQSDNELIEIDSIDTNIDEDRLHEVIKDLFGNIEIPEVSTFIFKHWS